MGWPHGGHQVAELAASDGVVNDSLGWSVAMSRDGSTAVVGAPGHDSDRGKVYVYTHSDGAWSQVARLTASDASPWEYFGHSVAVSATGKTVVVGAPGQSKAYVFTRSGHRWRQISELSPYGEPPESFGAAVAVSGDGERALVSDPGQGAHGVVYVFGRGLGTWGQAAQVNAPADDSCCGFGVELALSANGQTALVSAVNDEGGAGSAYVFAMNPDGTWVQTAELSPRDGRSGDDMYGDAVALSADDATAVVGAPAWKHFTGAAYTFTDASGRWTQTAQLTASDGGYLDYFGTAVAVSARGSTAVVAATGATGKGDTGAAYTFAAKHGGQWSQRAKLMASDGSADDEFGVSVAMSGDGATALIGASGKSHTTGVAYLFGR